MLEINSIHKTFNIGSVNEKMALDGIELTVCPGDFVTVIGGNGAGKSTLLNVIAGVYSIEKGSISIEGTKINNQPEHKRAGFIGRVFQDPLMGTAASMTIEENLAIALRRGKKRGLRWGLKQDERFFFKEQLVRLDLGLEKRLKTKVGLLSGGQRQALALLMASITKPKLLLLDEHTAALDPRTAVKVLELTELFIKQYSLTTLMVTHNMKDALRYGNRTIMLHEGKLVLDLNLTQKQKLRVEDLLRMFEKNCGTSLNNDRMLLAL